MYWLALGFFTLGLMSKPMIVTLPFTLLLLDYWPLGRIGGAVFDIPQGGTLQGDFRPEKPILQVVVEKIPFFVLAVTSGVITYLVQRAGGAVQEAEVFTVAVRIENAIVSYLRYIENFFYPAKLCVFYPYPFHWHGTAVAGSCFILIAISVAAIRTRKRFPFFVVGWLWFVGTLVPAIGLVQVGIQARADRYTYIPSIGILIALVWGIDNLSRRWRFRAAMLTTGMALASITCALLTERQIGFWRDSETLFRHALAVTRDNATANLDLGVALLRERRLDEAQPFLETAVRLCPESPKAQFDMGTLYFARNRFTDAVRSYEQGLRRMPNDPVAHFSLGIALHKTGHLDEAIAQFRDAVAA